jgi:predicted PurR-regulated permease PerM
MGFDPEEVPSGLVLARNAAIVSVVLVAVYGVARAAWFVVDMVLVLYIAVIFAVGLRGLSSRVAAKLPMSRKVALAGITAVVLGAPVLLGLVLWPELRHQFDQASDRIPELRQRFDQWVTEGEQALGSLLGEEGAQADAGEAPAPSPTDRALEQLGDSPSNRLLGWASGFVGGVSQALLGLFIILVVGIYVAIAPREYKGGLLALVPPLHRPRAQQVLAELGHALEWWIVGQLVIMLAVGTVTGTALAIAGVPMALLLGIVAGLLDFIPNFGPVMAVIPALLVGASEGKIVEVLLIYGGVQILEGWLLRPLVEHKAVETPPALLLSMQVLLGSLIGFMGLLAAPALLVAARILISRLYVDDVLDADALRDDPSGDPVPAA